MLAFILGAVAAVACSPSPPAKKQPTCSTRPLPWPQVKVIAAILFVALMGAGLASHEDNFPCPKRCPSFLPARSPATRAERCAW
jgi:hypothetical protein